MEASAALVEEKKKAEPREYVVLKAAKWGDEAGWVEIGRETVLSSGQAVKQAAGETPGEYLAVPIRSFKPVVVKVEKTTKVTFG